MADIGHWVYPTEFDANEWVGFIYRIIDNETNREYIGKKNFHSKRSKKVVGRVNKVWKTVPSNWKKYTSSSETINKLILEHGKERFTFMIESLHKTKASLTYAEVEKMIVEDALRTKLPDGTRKYYNGVIPPIKFLPPHEDSDEEAARIFSLIKDIYPNENFAWEHGLNEEEKAEYKLKYRFGNNNSAKRNKSPEEYEKYLNEHFRGKNNPMYGKTGALAPRYGKNPYENFTEEQMNEFKKIQSENSSGEKNGMFGRHPFANLTEEEMSEVKKKMSHPGPQNAMFGRPWYTNATDEEVKKWKDNISKGSKGKPKSEKTKEAMRKPKGPQVLVTCPHCQKEGGVSNLTRYHFNNCKKKPN